MTALNMLRFGAQIGEIWVFARQFVQENTLTKSASFLEKPRHAEKFRECRSTVSTDIDRHWR